MVKLFNNYEDELSLQEETRIKKVKKRNQKKKAGRPTAHVHALTNHFDVFFFCVAGWRGLADPTGGLADPTGGPSW